MPRKRKIEDIVDDSIRSALSHTYEKEPERLKAIALGVEWVKVKHKIDEGTEGAAFIGETEDE